MTKKTKLHVKPTPEELEANTQKALEEAEALKAPTEPVDEPTPSETIPSEPVSEPTPSEPTPSKEIIKDIAKRDKERLVASAQEAQILHAKNKKMNESLEKAMQTPDPTEEELQKKFPDWGVMSDFEKQIAQNSLKSEKQMSALGEIVKENKDLESWVTKVDDFVSDPATLTEYPDLEGKQTDFKLFATKPTRRNIDFEDIVSAFLYGVKPEPKQKGQMFPTGSGGPNDKSKTKGDKISIEEARTLRTTNYEKYKEMLRAGKIEIDL